ncbi:MAG TPA: NADPH:quinone oxidoreductase family protein [Terriglobales bacterium]|nr:NADPH:quinone oxidoreductase family protein [Terriglobales bacterium]HXZ58754.1 NADPH:quinone oxidoreductase family protein [Steroidobacteraceae bacterium]
MKALVCKAWGLPETLVVEELTDPVAGPGQAVVRVHAAGVNFPDALIIQNKYQFTPALPFVPGSECAGLVESVGDGVKQVKPGDRVIALTGSGAFAEKVQAEAAALTPLPEGVDFAIGSAFLLTYGTAYHALADRGALKQGETLLVLGASGGVGIAAIEIGKALGARVIAAASSEHKRSICREHGADEVIDYTASDLKPLLAALTGGKGVDVVFDPVGGAFTEAALRNCAWRGRHLVIGFANGEIPRVPANLLLLKGCSLIGVFWGRYVKSEPTAWARDLGTLFLWLRQGRLRPHVAERYPLERGAEALAALLARRACGKLVITPVAA